MIHVRRILCPIDLSDISRRAFDHAVALARRYDAEVERLRVGLRALAADLRALCC